MSSLPVFCVKCGAANSSQAKFCSVCGHAIRAILHQQPFTTTSTGHLVPNYLLKQRYCLLRQAGLGGFGAVYEAEDTLFNNLHVAVKEMSQSGLTAKEITIAADDFKREAKLLARLNHQSLPHIYDYFSETGRWYLVMDFINGETLEDYLEKTKGGYLPLGEVIDIGIQLCDVLDYLHNSQPPIIFRDLKPANVIRTPVGKLYLIDFGIARLFKAGQNKDTTALGSHGYAAPEQFGKATTTQSDIYSLGAMLHQLLTGNDPTSNTPTLFDFPPLQLPGQPTHPKLKTIITQMLEKDASKRPVSMTAVKQELQRVIAGQDRLPVGSASSKGNQIILSMQAPGISINTSRQPAASTPPRGTTLHIYKGHNNEVRDVAWSRDGTRIASGSDDKTVQVWDATTGKLIHTYSNHTSFVRAVTWSPDSKRIASGGNDKTVQVWDVLTGNIFFTYRGHSHWIRAIAWSPDGRYIASGGDDNTVQVWDALTGKLLTTFRDHTDSVLTVAWSPDSTRITSASDDNTVQLWAATTGKPIAIYRSHTKAIKAVAWSSDGQYIVSGSWDHTAQVWDANTTTHISTYVGHTKLINTVAWSFNSAQIASASKDKSVQIWDVSTGNTLFIYRNHSESVNALTWSPDGTRIASASDDKTVQIWQAI